MVSSWDQGKLLHRSINACLCPMYAVEGMHVVTVEGTPLPCLSLAHVCRLRERRALCFVDTTISLLELGSPG